jgi:hypothetical protein
MKSTELKIGVYYFITDPGDPSNYAIVHNMGAASNGVDEERICGNRLSSLGRPDHHHLYTPGLPPTPSMWVSPPRQVRECTEEEIFWMKLCQLKEDVVPKPTQEMYVIEASGRGFHPDDRGKPVWKVKPVEGIRYAHQESPDFTFLAGPVAVFQYEGTVTNCCWANPNSLRPVTPEEYLRYTNQLPADEPVIDSPPVNWDVHRDVFD